MKRYLLLITVFISLLILSCSDNNPVSSDEEVFNLPQTPEDPDAPEILQEWEDWIKANANKLETPFTQEFDDLQFFKPLLQNKSIVQLGESSHGVKEFNNSKVRLIKFLHEEMGFNIIAFESSVFDCFYSYRNLINGSALDLMRSSIYGVWHTYEVLNLFDYIKETQNTSNPLQLTGFDMKPSGSATRLYRAQFLHDVLNSFDQALAGEIYDIDTDLINFGYGDSLFLSVKDSFAVKYEQALSLVQTNWSQLVAQYSSEPELPHITYLTIKSIITSIKFYTAYQTGVGSTTTIRDQEMAYNLEYLYNNIYSGEKIIVWAHNFHIRYNNADVENTYSEGVQSMGHYLYENLKKDLYTVGFYMYKGMVATNTRQPVDVTPSSSENIEAILYRDRYYYSFVDMLYQSEVPGNSWMFDRMKLKYWGVTDQLMIAREQYDGLYFVYETSLPTYVSYSKIGDINFRDKYDPNF